MVNSERMRLMNLHLRPRPVSCLRLPPAGGEVRSSAPFLLTHRYGRSLHSVPREESAPESQVTARRGSFNRDGGRGELLSALVGEPAPPDASFQHGIPARQR